MQLQRTLSTRLKCAEITVKTPSCTMRSDLSSQILQHWSHSSFKQCYTSLSRICALNCSTFSSMILQSWWTTEMSVSLKSSFSVTAATKRLWKMMSTESWIMYNFILSWWTVFSSRMVGVNGRSAVTQLTSMSRWCSTFSDTWWFSCIWTLSSQHRSQSIWVCADATSSMISTISLCMTAMCSSFWSITNFWPWWMSHADLFTFSCWQLKHCWFTILFWFCSFISDFKQRCRLQKMCQSIFEVVKFRSDSRSEWLQCWNCRSKQFWAAASMCRAGVRLWWRLSSRSSWTVIISLSLTSSRMRTMMRWLQCWWHFTDKSPTPHAQTIRSMKIQLTFSKTWWT